MLQLKNITKIYGEQQNAVVALKDVSLAFRKSEFVSILGHSGCGKTTLLNILGGLDKYTKGDLIINGASTKGFKDFDWDVYRNNSIGFVFQSYNLISHLTVLGNVEMAMTLSGVSKKERKSRALQALEEVGLKDKANKKPNQLSGGQMQRVAIARAIVNEPSIILADEPTGALDTETSAQVINIIKKISENRLVIMVTHNNELAEEYSTRIIKLVDGEVEEDSHPMTKAEISLLEKEMAQNKTHALNTNNANDKALESVKVATTEDTKTKPTKEKVHKKSQKTKRKSKTAMSFFTAVNLSFKNLLTKKLRSILVSFAGSIGIIGVMLVLAVGNGFNIYLADFQKTSLMSLPINVETVSYNITHDAMHQAPPETLPPGDIEVTEKEESGIYSLLHDNKITPEYLEYLDNLNASVFGDNTSEYADIVYNRDVQKLFFNSQKQKLNEGVVKYDLILNTPEFMDKYLQVIAGELPKDHTELVIIADEHGRINQNFLKELGIELNVGEKISATQLLEQDISLKLFDFNDWFVQVGETSDFTGNYANIDTIYQNSPTLKIVGVVKSNEADELKVYGKGNSLGHFTTLDDHIYESAKTSVISTYFSNNNTIKVDGKTYPNLDNTSFLLTNYARLMQAKNAFAATEIPYSISIFAKDFEGKNKVKDYLNKYNINLEAENQIIFTDQAELITSMFGEIMNIITIVLIAFSAISLVVSSIMIGIITYISVIERTKEIGVLRSLGARKKDVSRVFIAESMIIGFVAGCFGIGISWLLTFPINSIVYKAVGNISKVAVVSVSNMSFMLLLSVVLTLIAGTIPAYIASKKDPVTALRTE